MAKAAVVRTTTKAAPKSGGAPKPSRRMTTAKRTSQGLRHAPLNKHKRRSWKKYRGQGRV